MMEASYPFSSEIVQYVIDAMHLYNEQNKFPDLVIFNQPNEFFFQCLECSLYLGFDDYLKYLIPKIVENLKSIPDIILKRFPLFLIDLLIESIPISQLDPDFLIHHFGFDSIEKRFKHWYLPKMSNIPFRVLTQFSELEYTQNFHDEENNDLHEENEPFYGTDINITRHIRNQHNEKDFSIELRKHFVANALVTYSPHQFVTSQFVVSNCTSLEIKSFENLSFLNNHIKSFSVLKELVITQCGQILPTFSINSFLLPTLVRFEISKTKLDISHFKAIISYVSENHDLKTLCLRETKMGAVGCELFVEAFRNGTLSKIENLDLSSNNTGGSIMIQLLEVIENNHAPTRLNNQGINEMQQPINPQIIQNTLPTNSSIIENQQINHPNLSQLIVQNQQIIPNIQNQQIPANPFLFVHQPMMNQNNHSYLLSHQLINTNFIRNQQMQQLNIDPVPQPNFIQNQQPQVPLVPNTLKSLAIDANFFSPCPDSISCLLRIPLKNLSLRGIHWDSESALRMREVLQMNSNVVFWDLAAQVVHQHSDPDLSPELAQEVLEKAHSNLEALFFSNHRIPHFNFNCISHLANLKALALINSNLVDDSLNGLEPLLNNLSFLDLSYNSFTFHNQQSASFLVNCIQSPTLKFLFLSNNNIGDTCGKLIFDTIREMDGNTHIRVLRLRNCFLKQKTSSALIELLATANLHLEELDVGGNDLFHKVHIINNDEIEEELNEEEQLLKHEFSKIRLNDTLKNQKIEHDDVFNIDFGINSNELMPKPKKVHKKSIIEHLLIGANNSKKDALYQLFDLVEGIKYLDVNSFLIPLVLGVSTKVNEIIGLSICFSKIVHAKDLIAILQNTGAKELWVINSISDSVLLGLMQNYKEVPKLMAVHIGTDLSSKKPKNSPIPIFVEGYV